MNEILFDTEEHVDMILEKNKVPPFGKVINIGLTVLEVNFFFESVFRFQKS